MRARPALVKRERGREKGEGSGIITASQNQYVLVGACGATRAVCGRGIRVISRGRIARTTQPHYAVVVPAAQAAGEIDYNAHTSGGNITHCKQTIPAYYKNAGESMYAAGQVTNY